ncbi:alpha/beta hydrolase [Colwellia sp. 4_MG-2023]|uniref:alpha/beta fold hydrolase n=1 Tax=unclassified Colwellia TaxID=196834 RepID=UPI0026E40A9F|nr:MULTISPECIES: alpha/beta hydrolase [unclassified Colwellia]MDO6508097.1 alpha/beta hydrolase [Colwellia sp. 5_MG-2023]MDO6556724.1 alpha/beta hydrolase [Colwellia sp. 4_MG-2023]
MKLQSNFALIDGVNIHYVSAGPTKNKALVGSTLLFLHGFPEYWQTWQAQLDYFCTDHHVIAPDLPGYNLSGKSEDVSFYEIPNLIEFFAKFIRAVSPSKKVYLVAHDWGGAIAWPLAAFYPQYIEKLIILNAAHPSTFTREMINNPIQREKSAYIHQLISAGAEHLLADNNYKFLREKILVASTPAIFTDEEINNYQQAWQQPDAINGMLQYYRAMPQLAANPNSHHEKESKDNPAQVSELSKMRIPKIRINVPTLILWGENDQAFVNENLSGIEEYVPDCRIERFCDATHWLTHEKSPEINNAIAHFINE